MHDDSFSSYHLHSSESVGGMNVGFSNGGGTSSEQPRCSVSSQMSAIPSGLSNPGGERSSKDASVHHHHSSSRRER